MKLLHGVRSKVNPTEIKMASQNFIQGPKMDWTEDPDLPRHFREWREETELLGDTALSHIKNKTIKMKFVTLWVGKEARTYLSTLLEEKKGQTTHFTKHTRRLDETKSRENCSLHTAQSSEPR